MKIVVEAFWDAEAQVWVASSAENIGLATEAATIEELQRKLAVMIPELMEEGNQDPVQVELVARSVQTIAAE